MASGEKVLTNEEVTMWQPWLYNGACYVMLAILAGTGLYYHFN